MLNRFFIYFSFILSVNFIGSTVPQNAEVKQCPKANEQSSSACTLTICKERISVAPVKPLTKVRDLELEKPKIDETGGNNG